MKRICAIMVFCMVLLTGCSGTQNGNAGSSSSNSKSVDYGKIIDSVVAYNHEMVEQGLDEGYKIEREKANFILWEDENNYYILARYNYQVDEIKTTDADGFKVGKENNRVSCSTDDRTKVVEYYMNNIPPIHTEENIELTEKDFDEDQMR